MQRNTDRSLGHLAQKDAADLMSHGEARNRRVVESASGGRLGGGKAGDLDPLVLDLTALGRKMAGALPDKNKDFGGSV